MSSQNQIMNVNYHTHMRLCRHAVGDVRDYVLEALRLNFRVLGMSDHAPFEELKDRSVRMMPEDYPEYLRQCNAAIEEFGDRIQILKALEIEYFPEHDAMYKKYLEDLDYLALGQHYIEDPSGMNGLKSSFGLKTINQLEKYVETVCQAMETGYFAFVCHPDLMLHNTSEVTVEVEALIRKLIQKAVETNTALEINANGIRKGILVTSKGLRFRYPREEFWQIAKEMNARIIISSDAHAPEQLMDSVVRETYDFARQLGIVVEDALVFPKR